MTPQKKFWERNNTQKKGGGSDFHPEYIPLNHEWKELDFLDKLRSKKNMHNIRKVFAEINHELMLRQEGRETEGCQFPTI